MLECTLASPIMPKRTFRAAGKGPYEHDRRNVAISGR